MIGRSIAERAQDDRIVWQQCVRKAQPLGHPNRMGRANRLWQMRGNRARLRRNEGLRATEHLVPPARNWIVGRGSKGQRHIVKRRQPTRLFLALNQERAVAVVHERHVGRPRRRRHRRRALMPRAADRIECLPLRPPRPEVEMAAHDLAIEQVNQLVRWHRERRSIAARRWKIMRGNPPHKCLIDDRWPVEHIGWVNSARRRKSHSYLVISYHSGRDQGSDSLRMRPRFEAEFRVSGHLFSAWPRLSCVPRQAAAL